MIFVICCCWLLIEMMVYVFWKSVVIGRFLLGKMLGKIVGCGGDELEDGVGVCRCVCRFVFCSW